MPINQEDLLGTLLTFTVTTFGVLDQFGVEWSHDDREAYSTFDMGAGFALFVAAQDAQRTVDVARDCGIEALIAGKIEAGPKQLLVEPLSIRFGDDDLQLR